jgi:tetratricopeptide (TPR) repeat protein
MARPASRSSELLAGVEHHKAERLDRAEALYNKVLAKSPGDPDALNLLGTIALARGRTARAIQLIEKSVGSNPSFAAAHSNLGNAYRAAGRMTDAADSYRKAIALNPGFADAHSNLAQVMADLGNPELALASSQKAVALAPTLPQPHRIMANAFRLLGRETEAIHAYRQALLLRPDDPAILDEFGECLAESRHFDEAVACHQRALALNPDRVISLLAFGGTLRRAGDIPGSVALYRRALAIDPKHAEAWASLGHGLRAFGQFEEAVESFNRAIAIDPGMADAYRGLSLIRQQDVDPNEIQRLETIRLDPAIATVDRVAAGFALGKSLDDSDRCDEAFARYSEANALYRQTLASTGKSFNTGAFITLVDQLISRFDADFFAAHAGWGDSSEVPVFVLGMPRSGTSLIEQIAASHPLVHGAGELSDIGQIEAQLGHHGWDRSDAARLASAHRPRLKKLGGTAIRVIDKMPDNILKLGVIGTLFPNARVIFCTRDPRDTCLSCFFQFFPHGNPYSYDLEQTGQRHVQIDRLAAHWRATLPLRMMEANYESLVHDPEGQSRAIIDFLGLPWDPACLSFHLTDRVVQTAGAWQVRQPMYDRAVGRWRRYRQHLGPLIEGLKGSILEQDQLY